MNRLVVGHWTEPLDWLTKIPAGWKPLVVTKDVTVPNEGREVASYLWAIQRLPRCDLVAFVQGNPFDHCPDLFKQLRKGADGFRWLGPPDHAAQANGAPHDGGLPVKETYERWLGQPFPGEVMFAAGGQFIIPRRLLGRYSMAEYREMYGHACHDRNAWCYERLWECLLSGPSGKLRVMAPPKRSSSRRYFTLKKEVPLKAGQTVGFTEGRGYYAKTVRKPPVKKPVPPKKPPETPRQAYVRWLKWGIAHNPSIHYAQARPMPIHLPKGTLPFTTDCSGFVTLMAKWAGRSDPNGLGYSGEGYTGTLLNHCTHITAGLARPGDLIVYGPGGGHHVVSIMKVLPDGDFEVCSHGQEHDPILIRHSVEKRYQPAPSTFLRFG